MAGLGMERKHMLANIHYLREILDQCMDLRLSMLDWQLDEAKR